jgi:hypothetical protein
MLSRSEVCGGSGGGDGVGVGGGGGGVVGGFSLLEDSLLEDESEAAAAPRAARKERKKLRQKQRREGGSGGDGESGPWLESNQERDELERMLAKSYSTASSASRIVPKRPQLKKLKGRELDEMTLKQLRNALRERRVSEDERGPGGLSQAEMAHKPDELKLLRELAKSLPSVCEEAAGIAKSRKRFVTDARPKAADGSLDEIDKILAKIEGDEGDSEETAGGTAVDVVVESGADTAAKKARAQRIQQLRKEKEDRDYYAQNERIFQALSKAKAAEGAKTAQGSLS